jgi:outer membrane protein OmpA-like peptidoglycan-associated protein
LVLFIKIPSSTKTSFKSLIMKKYLLLVVLFVANIAIGQNKIVKDHYTVSGGLLGAANFTKFRIADNDNFDYNYKFGWGAGGWLNIPLNKGISIEPQVIYNSYAYNTDAATAFLRDVTATYISVPVLLKFHVGKNFAITAGPQFDFLAGFEDKNNNNTKSDLTSTSIAGNIGFEVFPHGRVVPFARYIHGFTNMDNTDNPNTVGKYYNTNFQVGLKLRLFGKHVLADSDGDGILDKDDKCPTVVGLARYQGCPIPDTDGDGINDEEDKCPTVAGLAKYQGCPIPDRDKDGINDEEDKCPDVPGLPKYAGCPVPDTDKDGVNDEEDKCPQVPGLAKYQGCPIPDTDGDGINDEEDKCPTIAGVPENGGCPQINFKAGNIQFVSGSSTLTSGAKNELNKLAKILNEDYKDIKILIVGHTDNSGIPEKNFKLSVDRAESVKTYLTSKGVNESRLTATGFGQDQPISDNTSAAGKAKNRRVEFKISQ